MSDMTLRARIRAGLMGLPTDRVPLHCRLRMAPLTPEYQWVRDLGWGVVGGAPGFDLHYADCAIAWEHGVVDGRACRRQTVRTPRGMLTAVETDNAAGGKATLEYYFKTPSDYPALLAMINSMRYAPAYDAFLRSQNDMGEWGYAYSWCGYDPMHTIMVQLIGVEAFCYEWADNRDRILELYEALRVRHREMFRIVAEGPAEFVTYGGNIQPTIVGRERFEQYYLPVFQEGGAVLHASGKRIGAHMDDATGTLRDLLAQCPWDVMEAWAVSPDGDMSLPEAAAAWPGRVISLNFPSKYHHASESEIRAAARRYVAEAPPTGGLLISLTEDFPKDGERRIFTAIAEAVPEV